MPPAISRIKINERILMTILRFLGIFFLAFFSFLAFFRFFLDASRVVSGVESWFFGAGDRVAA